MLKQVKGFTIKVKAFTSIVKGFIIKVKDLGPRFMASNFEKSIEAFNYEKLINFKKVEYSGAHLVKEAFKLINSGKSPFWSL